MRNDEELLKMKESSSFGLRVSGQPCHDPFALLTFPALLLWLHAADMSGEGVNEVDCATYSTGTCLDYGRTGKDL